MILHSSASVTSAYKKIDIQIKCRFEEIRDCFRRSHLVSVGPQEKLGTLSKPADYSDVGVNEDAQCRLKPGDESVLLLKEVN